MPQKRKPVVTVWCLPANLSEGELRQISSEVVATFTSQPGLDIHSESDLVVLFPPDRMSYGLGSEIVITVEGVEFNLSDDRVPTVCSDPLRALAKEMADYVGRHLKPGHDVLAGRLTRVFALRFPGASIQCTVRGANPYEGFASADPKTGE